ncbi:hypothetical protein [Thermobifida cellulosilytica]|uniref:DUF8129 domain-containing protein n=1 Tax=Thermobifida cellulosilytica TB100 TaxID=665004 RepID=A0A147KJP6_THECS|nr:hypothetical protein [Thermobifida cellulosilytica]KUP97471.1 hypothetical protein AC529_06400 [Thermobifida cellulosilytica TB100]
MPSLRRDDLMIPDYEYLPLGTLQHRIRALDQEQMRQLIAYEEAHARRTPVLELMYQRLRSLQEGAQPSSGDQTAAPEVPPPASGDSPVSRAGQAPAAGPPPHGNPAQPGRAKGDRRT